MNSLKTGVIIAFGLTVLYGVYLVINKPEPTPEAKAEAEATPELAIGEMEDSGGEDAGAEGSEEPLEEERPAAQVADSGKPSSRFGGREETPPEEPVDSEETPVDPVDSGDPDEEMDERPEVAPWRKNQERPGPKTSDAEEETAPEETAPRDEMPEEKSATSRDEAAADSKGEEAEEVEAEPVERSAPAVSAAEFDAAWSRMEMEIEEGKLKEALATISPFYHATDLDEEDSKHLIEVLDLLAWRVVFSKEHFLAKPHVVAAGETLDEIAEQHQVPAEVLAKVNGIKSAKSLKQGTELKIIPGPFRAEVSPERGVLTLFLGDLYATRYAIESGTEPPPEAGEYRVLRRLPGEVYPSKSDGKIAAHDPRNPYGGVYLDLGDGQAIHGSPAEEAEESLGSGCIRLQGKDAKEVYWLLSKGASVSVVR